MGVHQILLDLVFQMLFKKGRVVYEVVQNVYEWLKKIRQRVRRSITTQISQIVKSALPLHSQYKAKYNDAAIANQSS